jgi:hypothetical protein
MTEQQAERLIRLLEGCRFPMLTGSLTALTFALCLWVGVHLWR